MANTPKPIELTEDEKIIRALNERISNNLHTLLQAENLSCYQAINMLKEKNGYSISASYFNKILNHPNKYKIPVIFLMQCAEFFNITIDNLISNEFNPHKKKDPEESSSNLNTLLAEYNEHQENTPINDIFEDTSPSSSDSLFIANPNNILFKSILQPYFCYFYPTASKENKSIDSILQGTLEFKKDGSRCKTIFTIHANKNDKNKQPIIKTYEGYSVISVAVNNLYSILKSENIGEYCFLIFRHFHLNYELQDCHMAEMLSTSSAKKERYPTALRIFLSKEPIKPEHISLIAPHLWLNYSQITISKEKLFSLKKVSENYEAIIEQLLKKATSDSMLIFKEKDAIGIAQNYLSKSDALKFITDLRSKSYAFHYNKVSDTVNDNIHDLLLSLGYYQ